jgi:uncharacterized protein
MKLEDLTPGMELTGTVLNVVDFGCFVDIGMHDSGLVHVSRLADKFIRDPHDVVAVGDIVRVWVMEIDKERRRVSLTMVKPGSEHPRPPHHGKPEHGKPQGEGAPQHRREGQQGGQRSSGERRPPRPQGGRPQGQGHGRPQQQQYRQPPRPRPAPKPLIPITDEMKTGKAPMRTFGDLLQFYQQKPEPEPVVKQKPPKQETPKAVEEKSEPVAEPTAEAPSTPSDESAG